MATITGAATATISPEFAKRTGGSESCPITILDIKATPVTLLCPTATAAGVNICKIATQDIKNNTVPLACLLPSVWEGANCHISTQDIRATPVSLPCQQNPITLLESSSVSKATDEIISTPATPISGESTTTSPPTGKIGGGNSNDGLSGGAVAGVAIGCLIAGAAIAAIVLLLLFRRRRNKQAAGFVQHHLPYNSGHGGAEKVPIVATTAVASSIDNLIPQPVEDEAITKEVSRLRDNIKNHVRTYYRFDPVGPVDIPHAQLAGLAAATGITTNIFVESLLNPAKRDSALRLYLAWAIFSRCEGNRLPSLLPGGLAALTASVPASQPVLYSKWKAITGVLFKHHSQEPSVQSQSIAEAIDELNTVVAPFVQGSADGGQRRKNLEMILSRASSLAFLLFSQPGSFRFDFTSHRGAPVIFPGVDQVIGDQAQVLSPPRLLWEREYAAEG